VDLEVDAWRVIDRWWTDEPEARCFVVLTMPDGAKATVRYEMREKTWHIQPEEEEDGQATIAP
jgi:hypothetical protein